MIHARLFVLPLVVLVWSATGCGSDKEPVLGEVEEANCRFEIPRDIPWKRGKDYRCGYLTVAENPADPAGRTLRLHFFQTLSGRDHAVVYLDGGPGGNGGSILSFLGNASFRDRLLAAGDLVVFAQRGTAFSSPALMCTEKEEEDAKEPLLFNCRKRLSKRSELANYTTPNNADDVEALRVGLGYRQFSLYGISYGSRLALEVARRHPAGVRAMVIDGVAPPGVNWQANHGATFMNALKELDRGCREMVARDPSYLRRAYDSNNTSTEFCKSFDYTVSALRELRDNPLKVSKPKFEVSANFAASLIFKLMYNRESAMLVPPLAISLARRDATVLLRLLEKAPGLFDRDDTATAMHYSMVCNELFNPADPSLWDRLNASVPPEISAPMKRTFDALLKTCPEWPMAAPDPLAQRVVESDIPTLVSSGSIDPVTPASSGDAAAQGLRAAQVVVFSGSSHGATLETECGRNVLLSFIGNPATATDLRCASALPSFPMPEPN